MYSNFIKQYHSLHLLCMHIYMHTLWDTTTSKKKNYLNVHDDLMNEIFHYYSYCPIMTGNHS